MKGRIYTDKFAGRTGASHYPELAEVIARRIVEIPNDTLIPIARIAPEKVSSQPIINILESYKKYALASIEKIAEKDPSHARELAKCFEIPVVRPVEGRSSFLIEKMTVEEYLRRENRKLAEQVVDIVVKK